MGKFQIQSVLQQEETSINASSHWSKLGCGVVTNYCERRNIRDVHIFVFVKYLENMYSVKISVILSYSVKNKMRI